MMHMFMITFKLLHARERKQKPMLTSNEKLS